MSNPARFEIPPLSRWARTGQSRVLRPLPEIILFEHEDFNLNHLGEEEGDSWRTTLDFPYVGDDWRDEISSLIILAGLWEFYERPDYQGEQWPPVRLGPGHYPRLPRVGIPNDRINSFRALSR